jgi:hypothetical protein
MINNLNDLKKSLSETIPDSFKKDDLQTFAKETTKSIPVTLDILQDILPILKDDKINDIDGYIFQSFCTCFSNLNGSQRGSTGNNTIKTGNMSKTMV